MNDVPQRSCRLGSPFDEDYVKPPRIKMLRPVSMKEFLDEPNEPVELFDDHIESLLARVAKRRKQSQRPKLRVVKPGAAVASVVEPAVSRTSNERAEPKRLITVRVTDEQHSAICLAAIESRMSVNSYILKMLGQLTDTPIGKVRGRKPKISNVS